MKNIMNKIITKRNIIFLALIVFVLGLIVYATQRIRIEEMSEIEQLQNRSKNEAKCPNVLVRRGNHLYLYNTTDRTNSVPVHFNNLDEYTEYVNAQRSQGIQCPILFLQEESDVQGKDVYRVRPSPYDLQGGMQPVNENGQHVTDASRDGDYNTNMFAGFDPQNQDIGVFTELDKIHISTSKENVSDNPMDTNWGGVEHTQSSVEFGKYENRQVTKPVYFTPNTQFFPDLGNRVPPHSFISSSGTAI